MIENCWVADRCNKRSCAEDFCMRKYKLDCLYEHTLLPESYKKEKPLYLDETEVDKLAYIKLSNIRKDINNFVNSGNNLHIHSAVCGNGKTEWAVRLLKAYLFSIWHSADVEACRGLFIHVPKFLQALKDNISEKSEYVKYVKENIYNADLVVFDEFATGEFTRFEGESILSIVNDRINNKKSNIYTSNISNKELRDLMGERLYSRVVQDSIEVVFNESDKRGK